jgi:hypothetical protein
MARTQGQLGETVQLHLPVPTNLQVCARSNYQGLECLPRQTFYLVRRV